MVAGLLPMLQMVAQSSAPVSEEYQFGYAMGVLIGGLLVMLLFGHLSGKLAQSVGGNYWLFAIIGFFFGFIIPIMYYAYVKVRRKPPALHGQPQMLPQQQAPYFTSTQPVQAPPVQQQLPVFTASPPLARATPPAGNETQSGMKTCRKCGADNPGSAKSCWRCQEQLIPA